MQTLPEAYQLTHYDLAHLLKAELTPDTPLRLCPDLPSTVFTQIPFLQGAEHFLECLAQEPNAEIKLTSRGALPVDYVQNIYQYSQIKEAAIESGAVKLNQEVRSPFIRTLHFVLTRTPYAKSQHNRLSLTQSGLQWLEEKNRQRLLATLLHAYASKSLILDAAPYSQHIEKATLWSLYMLLLHRHTPLPSHYLTELLFMAQPKALGYFMPHVKPRTKEAAIALASQIYHTRIGMQFLNFFGWATASPAESNLDSIITPTPTLSACFELVLRHPLPDNFVARISLLIQARPQRTSEQTSKTNKKRTL